ncbi:unnamed protein product [Strongylus vulgaris]|uniref:Metalloendopeptidase n=1 Tax=Strongylus vulgaris TaxID=40348 RepID=A0A3P7J023_STRVU|nr:unnamed protein product [Strongylus vulgaris]
MLEANEKRTCIVRRIVQHELLHVIGLWHEHMRHDRDDYIKIHYENVRENHLNQNFRKLSPSEVTTYNVPYDYRSVMHYGARAFTKNGKITIETLDPKFQDIIGKSEGATPSDYRKVCEIYS